jgi:hypothetical protein
LFLLVFGGVMGSIAIEKLIQMGFGVGLDWRIPCWILAAAGIAAANFGLDVLFERQKVVFDREVGIVCLTRSRLLKKTTSAHAYESARLRIHPCRTVLGGGWAVEGFEPGWSGMWALSVDVPDAQVVLFVSADIDVVQEVAGKVGNELGLKYYRGQSVIERFL